MKSFILLFLLLGVFQLSRASQLRSLVLDELLAEFLREESDTISQKQIELSLDKGLKLNLDHGGILNQLEVYYQEIYNIPRDQTRQTIVNFLDLKPFEQLTEKQKKNFSVSNFMGQILSDSKQQIFEQFLEAKIIQFKSKIFELKKKYSQPDDAIHRSEISEEEPADFGDQAESSSPGNPLPIAESVEGTQETSGEPVPTQNEAYEEQEDRGSVQWESEQNLDSNTENEQVSQVTQPTEEVERNQKEEQGTRIEENTEEEDTVGNKEQRSQITLVALIGVGAVALLILAYYLVKYFRRSKPILLENSGLLDCQIQPSSEKSEDTRMSYQDLEIKKGIN